MAPFQNVYIIIGRSIIICLRLIVVFLHGTVIVGKVVVVVLSAFVQRGQVRLQHELFPRNVRYQLSIRLVIRIRHCLIRLTALISRRFNS